MIKIFLHTLKKLKCDTQKLKKEILYALSRIIPLLSLSRYSYFFMHSKSMSVNYLQVQLNLI